MSTQRAWHEDTARKIAFRISRMLIGETTTERGLIIGREPSTTSAYISRLATLYAGQRRVHANAQACTRYAVLVLDGTDEPTAWAMSRNRANVEGEAA